MKYLVLGGRFALAFFVSTALLAGIPYISHTHVFRLRDVGYA